MFGDSCNERGRFCCERKQSPLLHGMILLAGAFCGYDQQLACLSLPLSPYVCISSSSYCRLDSLPSFLRTVSNRFAQKREALEVSASSSATSWKSSSSGNLSLK